MQGMTNPTWTWPQALSGVVPPLISPLDAAGQPDGAAMARLVEHGLAGGVSGFFVLGGCGEGAWLTPSQRSAVIRTTVAAARGRAPVLAGVDPITVLPLEVVRLTGEKLNDPAIAVYVTDGVNSGFPATPYTIRIEEIDD